MPGKFYRNFPNSPPHPKGPFNPNQHQSELFGPRLRTASAVCEIIFSAVDLEVLFAHQLITDGIDRLSEKLCNSISTPPSRSRSVQAV